MCVRVCGLGVIRKAAAQHWGLPRSDVGGACEGGSWQGDANRTMGMSARSIVAAGAWTIVRLKPSILGNDTSAYVLWVQISRSGGMIERRRGAGRVLPRTCLNGGLRNGRLCTWFTSSNTYMDGISRGPQNCLEATDCGSCSLC